MDAEIPTPAPASTAAERRIVFDAILHPHRSLTRVGFFAVMAVMAASSLILGTIFYLAGAWPIVGFCGLDVLVLYLALKRNFRDALIYETVRLTADELRVEKGDIKGPQRVWTFQPHWLRVAMDDPPEHESQVVLSSHGRSVVVGAFLSPAERLDFARALSAELDRLRRPGAQWAGSPA